MQHHTKAAVAKLAGVTGSNLQKHLDKGAIPEPTVPVGRRHYYSLEGTLEVVSYFSKRRPHDPIIKKEGN